jgi:hypothetical protein
MLSSRGKRPEMGRDGRAGDGDAAAVQVRRCAGAQVQ